MQKPKIGTKIFCLSKPYPKSTGTDGHFTKGNIYSVVCRDIDRFQYNEHIVWLKSDKNVPYALLWEEVNHCFSDLGGAAKVLFTGDN